jgi:hypothetical protein
MGTDDAGQKLKMLFPDEGQYNDFIAQMEQEQARAAAQPLPDDDDADLE